VAELVDPDEYDAETTDILDEYSQRLVRVAALTTVVWVGLAVLLAFYRPGSSAQLAGPVLLVLDVVFCGAAIGLTWLRVRMRRRTLEVAIAAGRAELEANGWRSVADEGEP
jgi:Na+/proline symporter